jgi:hypothetical protein
MEFLLRNRLFYIWLFLSGLTVLTWWLGAHGSASGSPPITYSVLLIVIVKTRFVIRNFMEVCDAPLWLQRSCDAWLVFLFAILALFYRFAV